MRFLNLALGGVLTLAFVSHGDKDTCEHWKSNGGTCTDPKTPRHNDPDIECWDLCNDNWCCREEVCKEWDQKGTCKDITATPIEMDEDTGCGGTCSPDTCCREEYCEEWQDRGGRCVDPTPVETPFAGCGGTCSPDTCCESKTCRDWSDDGGTCKDPTRRSLSLSTSCEGTCSADTCCREETCQDWDRDGGRCPDDKPIPLAGSTGCGTCKSSLCCEVCDPLDDKCSGSLVCCDNTGECVTAAEYKAMSCGDPHMTGFLGQKFDFTGEDGAWYCLIADENININMRVTSPVVDLPEITYITGLSVLTSDADGFDHSIVIEVKDPHNMDSSCPAGVSPCLADGSLRVILDGEETLLAPGTVSLGQGVQVTAANLPGACRSFGFEKYWERKKLENVRQGRRLSEALSMGEWILGDPTATNMDECMEYVAHAGVEDGGLFAHQSEHASFQIVTPKATIRLSHGRLDQIAMRDPTDQYDLPDHLAWQMNMAVDHNEVSRDAKGVLGETFVPTRDATGKPIMIGMEAIRGKQEDYRVEGALGTDFVQDAQTS